MTIPLPFDWGALQNGSDIRGVALEGVAGESVNITPEVAKRIAQGFTQWLAQQKNRPIETLCISIGRDSRISGADLLDAMVEGMLDLNVSVYDFELASTPAMFMSTVTEEWLCDGAIMITASHLPFNRNGFKFFTEAGGLEKQDIGSILALAQSDYSKTTGSGQHELVDFMSIYSAGLVEMIRQKVNHPNDYLMPLNGLKIVVDAGNGAGGFFTEKVLKPLGADTQGSQFLQPYGRFPNHVPNPEDPQAMQSISDAVRINHADFGIIFDTDVDRSAAVDHQGLALNRNRLIALISAIVLAEHPQTTIVTDSVTSDGLTEFIDQHLKGHHHRFKRGYKNVINEAIRLNSIGQPCWLAIETSGHAALKENYFLDDGAFLVSKLLIELAKAKLNKGSITDLIKSLQDPLDSQEFRFQITVDDFKANGTQVIEQLQPFVEQQTDWQPVENNYEGVRVRCLAEKEQGWFLLRLSLHDPVLALNVESNKAGGVELILQRLTQFLSSFEFLKRL